jgi:hypothetical protein
MTSATARQVLKAHAKHVDTGQPIPDELLAKLRAAKTYNAGSRRAHRRTGRARTGWAHPPTSAPGLGSPLPHLRRDWAHPSHICAGTGLTPPTPAPRLAGFDVIEYTSSALLDQALHALPAEKLRTLDLAAFEEETLAVGAPCHICTGTGLTPCHICTGTHLHRDWGRSSHICVGTHPSHSCAGTGLTPPTAMPGLGSPRRIGTGTGRTPCATSASGLRVLLAGAGHAGRHHPAASARALCASLLGVELRGRVLLLPVRIVR